MTRKTFTVFCRESDDTGTTWISTVQAKDVEDAKRKAVLACADDWGYSDDEDDDDEARCGDIDDIVCIGVAKGNVKILDWEDIS